MRVKVGVGEKPKNWDLADYVLSPFTKDERPLVNLAIEHAAKAIEQMLNGPELTGNDLRWKLCFDRILAANAALYEELLGGLSLDGCPPRYGVPVILTAGERDWTTPYPLAAAYYDTLSAPCKAFLSLPDAGHLPFRERPEEWSHILLDALAQI